MSTTAGRPSAPRPSAPRPSAGRTSTSPIRRTAAASPARKPERLVSLDVFRGLTIAGMILVTDPGTYGAVYRPLLHAAWDGWTPTDMIFPSFLFIVGLAMTFSFRSRLERGDSRGKLVWHIVRRALILCLLGLFLNAFPRFELSSLRIPGILQRIALCFSIGGLLYLACSRPSPQIPHRRPKRDTIVRVSVIVAVILVFLTAYWALLKLFPVPGFGPGRMDSLGNLGAWIDRAVFGTHHLWAYGLNPGHGVTYDPEGLLSTIPATASLLIGILTGEWLRSDHSPMRKLVSMVLLGSALMMAGQLLNPWMPINKRIWTTTFALFSSGFSLIAFSVCYWIVDIRRWRWWIAPSLVFGTNAIFAFALSTVVTSLFDFIHVSRAGATALTLHAWAYTRLFLPWLSPIHASLAYAITIVLLNLALVSVLYGKRIFLRI